MVEFGVRVWILSREGVGVGMAIGAVISRTRSRTRGRSRSRSRSRDTRNTGNEGVESE